MKRYLLLAAAGLAALFAGSAGAVTATNTFNVSITLNSACQVVTVPTIAFTYTSFQTTAATTSSTFDVRCTSNKSITSIRLDDGAGGVATALTQSYTDSVTGLTYSLTLASVPTTGTGIAQTVSISGTMGAGQAGQCNAASCTSNSTRTITITY